MQKKNNLEDINILVTGAAGYIGSMLCTELVTRGYNVTAVDLLKYDSNSISHLFYFKNFKFFRMDVSKKQNIKKLIINQDYIIPLAALVGAPLCEKNKKQAIDINYKSIQILVKLIKKRQKIIFPTTNSGYGIGLKDKYCDEKSPLKPISLYGRTKKKAEDIIKKHKNSVRFRLATVFGVSYRMRSDLLVNNFVETAVKKRIINLYESDFRRNYIHIRDVINAFIFSIENFKKLRNHVYNLGLSEANLTKFQLCEKIKLQIPGLIIRKKKNKKDPDKRDYFVSNKKIESRGFKASISLEYGIREMKKFFIFVDKIVKNNY